ncbi:MAG: glycosyltransferase [Halanaerobiales bacterium]|nr:glycosyltransferase [Halanaerobiales bacterium]
MIKNYARIKIINQENKGISANHNSELKHCKKEYIYFFDSNDLL